MLLVVLHSTYQASCQAAHFPIHNQDCRRLKANLRSNTPTPSGSPDSRPRSSVVDDGTSSNGSGRVDSPGPLSDGGSTPVENLKSVEARATGSPRGRSHPLPSSPSLQTSTSKYLSRSHSVQSTSSSGLGGAAGAEVRSNGSSTAQGAPSPGLNATSPTHSTTSSSAHVKSPLALSPNAAHASLSNSSSSTSASAPVSGSSPAVESTPTKNSPPSLDIKSPLSNASSQNVPISPPSPGTAAARSGKLPAEPRNRDNVRKELDTITQLLETARTNPSLRESISQMRDALRRIHATELPLNDTIADVHWLLGTAYYQADSLSNHGSTSGMPSASKLAATPESRVEIALAAGKFAVMDIADVPDVDLSGDVAPPGMPTGPMNLSGALAWAVLHYRHALKSFTAEHYQERFLAMQTALGEAFYLHRIVVPDAVTGEEGLDLAIKHYSAALEALGPKEDNATDYATVHNMLGSCYAARLNGDRGANIDSAINHFQDAVNVTDSDPSMASAAALMHYNLGMCYFSRINGTRKDNVAESVKHYTESLKVLHPLETTAQWSTAHYHLNVAYAELAKAAPASDVEGLVALSLAHLAAFFTVRSQDEYPEQYRMLQDGLRARAAQGLPDLPDFGHGVVSPKTRASVVGAPPVLSSAGAAAVPIGATEKQSVSSPASSSSSSVSAPTPATTTTQSTPIIAKSETSTEAAGSKASSVEVTSKSSGEGVPGWLIVGGVVGVAAVGLGWWLRNKHQS